MKSAVSMGRMGYSVSLPVRGAWVEINMGGEKICVTGCRSPCGERGLK